MTALMVMLVEAQGAGECKALSCVKEEEGGERRFSRGEPIVRVRVGRFIHQECWEMGEG